MPDLILYSLIGLVALLIGGGAGFWIGQTRGRSDAAKSVDIERELDAYREQVSEHFGKTAEHFQALGVQVRELYDHMAVGAETLCEPGKTDKAIAFSATAALQQTAAAAPDDATTESPAEESAEPEPESESAAAEETDAAAADPEESSFTVSTPDEDDPDKRSYH